MACAVGVVLEVRGVVWGLGNEVVVVVYVDCVVDGNCSRNAATEMKEKIKNIFN